MSFIRVSNRLSPNAILKNYNFNGSGGSGRALIHTPAIIQQEPPKVLITGTYIITVQNKIILTYINDDSHEICSFHHLQLLGVSQELFQ